MENDFRHKFIIDDKYWICETLTKRSNIPSQCENVSIFCARYGVSELVVKEWLVMYEQGHQMYEGFCIPYDRSVDSIGLEAIWNYDFDKR